VIGCFRSGIAWRKAADSAVDEACYLIELAVGAARVVVLVLLAGARYAGTRKGAVS
jgi:hypothetical protein